MRRLVIGELITSECAGFTLTACTGLEQGSQYSCCNGFMFFISQLSKVKAQKPFEEMTVSRFLLQPPCRLCGGGISSVLFPQIDEYLADKPEIRKQAEQDMKNHIWYMGKEQSFRVCDFVQYLMQYLCTCMCTGMITTVSNTSVHVHYIIYTYSCRA